MGLRAGDQALGTGLVGYPSAPSLDSRTLGQAEGGVGHQEDRGREAKG